MSPPALDIDRVSFAYGQVPVLHDVSLCVREGEFVAVVGANGSGKTTVMKLALALLRTTTGSVRLFGCDIDSYREWWKVGYVPQRAQVLSALPVSVEEVVNTGLAARARCFGRRRRGDHERCEHVIELMGLAGDRRSRMSELSGGQQQRALIARALVTAPRLLVLDEPTTGVDAQARGVLRESLQNLVDVEGMAVVYVSHDPEGFTGLAQRVVAVQGGRVRVVDQSAARPEKVAVR